MFSKSCSPGPMYFPCLSRSGAHCTIGNSMVLNPVELRCCMCIVKKVTNLKNIFLRSVMFIHGMARDFRYHWLIPQVTTIELF